MRKLTMSGVAAAALLAAAPALAQVGFHPGPGGAGLWGGARSGTFHDVKYPYRHDRPHHRYHRAYRPYYERDRGTAPEPTLPSWYGQSSYHSSYFPH